MLTDPISWTTLSTSNRRGVRTFKHFGQILEVEAFNRLFGRLALFGPLACLDKFLGPAE